MDKELPNTPAMVLSTASPPVRQSLLRQFQAMNRKRRAYKKDWNLGIYLWDIAYTFSHTSALRSARLDTDAFSKTVTLLLAPIIVPFAFITGRLVNIWSLLNRCFKYVWYGE